MQKSGRVGNNLQLINDALGYVEFFSISVNRIVDGDGARNECAGIPSVDSIVSSATSKICGQDVTANKNRERRNIELERSGVRSPSCWRTICGTLMLRRPTLFARHLIFACFLWHFYRFDSSADCCRPSSLCLILFGVFQFAFLFRFFLISMALTIWKTRGSGQSAPHIWILLACLSMFHKDKELKLAKGAVEGGHKGGKNLRFFCSI